MNNLFEELNNYQDLISTKDKLNNELLSLSGRNDPDNIKRINEIGANLNQINSSLQEYNKEDLVKVESYYETMKEFNRLTGELQTIEKLSKKSKGEKSEVLSSEGRKKYIDKSLIEEYSLLAEQKRNLRKKITSEYKTLERISSVITPSNSKKEEVHNIQNIDYVLPTIKDYNELTIEEKQKELEDRLQRIFDSSKLPNQGKKISVPYNNKKYPIPKIYQGRFNETVRELNAIKKNLISKETPKVIEQKPELKLTPIETFDFKIEEEDNPYIYGHYNPKPNSITLSDLIDICEKNKIKLHPLSVSLKKTHKINIKKAYTTVKNKASLENFKKLLPKVWNIDKYTILGLETLNSKILDEKIIIKKPLVKFANNTIQKYNTTKAFLVNTSKKTKNYIKNKYKDIKKFYQDKKEIIERSKDEKTLNVMKEVYGTKVENHLDYRIINRTTNFKENTCQRIKTAKGKITETSINVVNAIKKPFDYLRENMKNDVKRSELQGKIEEIRIANRQKEEALKRIKINSNAGYVGTITITIIGVFALAAIIFIGIGSIINR